MESTSILFDFFIYFCVCIFLENSKINATSMKLPHPDHRPDNVITFVNLGNDFPSTCGSQQVEGSSQLENLEPDSPPDF